MNAKAKLRLIVGFIFTVYLAACSNGGGYGNSDNTGYGKSNSGYGSSSKSKKTAAVTEQVKEVKKVTIKNFKFEPSVITISAGDSVVFINEDGAPHTATATSGEFGTEQLAKGESGTIVVDDAGTFQYFCAIHPSMKGTIIVQ